LKPTHGSLFAGIGGFDLGFERAGWKTNWQVEIDPWCSRILARHWPRARRLGDVRQIKETELSKVDCITAGFPCQDISTASNSGRQCGLGLRGAKSGLFFQALRLIRALQPDWIVIENVPALLHTNDGKDIEAVVSGLADVGYLGFWRVLNGAGFGVPQNRRRLFLVAGFGRFPPLGFLFDAAPMEAIPCAFGALQESQKKMAWAGHTLLKHEGAGQICLGNEPLVCEKGRRRAMVERERVSQVSGLPTGLVRDHFRIRQAAGNAIIPAIAEWIGQLLHPSAARRGLLDLDPRRSTLALGRASVRLLASKTGQLASAAKAGGKAK